MAKGEQEEKVGFLGKLKQIGLVFKFTTKQDKWFLPLAAAAVVIPLAVTVAAIMVGVGGWLWLPMGFMLSLLALLIVLNMRSNKVFMAMAEEQRGAAAQIMERMRGDWRVTPAIISTTQMDMVHLVLNRRGVILVAEGERQRLRGLLGQQKKRLSKVIGSAPLYDVVLGHGEDEVPLRKLRMYLTKLPKTMSGRDVNSLDKRLKALAARPRMPQGAIPKEMIPKNMRPPRNALRGR